MSACPYCGDPDNHVILIFDVSPKEFTDAFERFEQCYDAQHSTKDAFDPYEAYDRAMDIV